MCAMQTPGLGYKENKKCTYCNDTGLNRSGEEGRRERKREREREKEREREGEGRKEDTDCLFFIFYFSLPHALSPHHLSQCIFLQVVLCLLATPRGFRHVPSTSLPPFLSTSLSLSLSLSPSPLHLKAVFGRLMTRDEWRSPACLHVQSTPYIGLFCPAHWPYQGERESTQFDAA